MIAHVVSGMLGFRGTDGPSRRMLHRTVDPEMLPVMDKGLPCGRRRCESASVVASAGKQSASRILAEFHQ